MRDHLTQKGIKQVKYLAHKLKKCNIDLIFYSPLLRTQETFEIINNELKIDSDSCIIDDRLTENNFGDFDEKPYENYQSFFSSFKERFEKPVPHGENYADVLQRVKDFTKEIESKYKNKNILIVSHGFPARLLQLYVLGLNKDEMMEQLKANLVIEMKKIIHL